MPIRTLARLLPIAALGAQDARPTWAFVHLGSNPDQVEHLGAGVAWPFAWKRQALGGEFSAQAELSLSYWNARAFGGGQEGFWNVGLVPLLRYRLSDGSSPWFVEAGIGINASNKRYVTPDKTFSTRLNFSDNVALGRSFGTGWNQELSLRLQHSSNAGIKKPNPGEDFVLVRYAYRF
jgi:lipid A 3-O-deacylase